MTIWQIIAGWFQTLVTVVKGNTSEPIVQPTVTTTPTGTVVTPPTLEEKLVSLIEHINGPEGPFISTGGQIFSNNPEQNFSLATSIVAAVDPLSNVTVSMLASIVAGESKFSVLAVDPNYEKPVVAPKTRSDYTDYGPIQLNATEFGNYTDLAGMSFADQVETVEDPTWALPVLSQILGSLLTWGQGIDLFLRSNDRVVPVYGADYRVLALDAYNRGRSGSAVAAILPYLDRFAVTVDAQVVLLTLTVESTTLVHTKALAVAYYMERTQTTVVPAWGDVVSYFSKAPPDKFAYGNGVVSRAAEYAQTLGVAA